MQETDCIALTEGLWLFFLALMEVKNRWDMQETDCIALTAGLWLFFLVLIQERNQRKSSPKEPLRAFGRASASER